MDIGLCVTIRHAPRGKLERAKPTPAPMHLLIAASRKSALISSDKVFLQVRAQRFPAAAASLRRSGRRLQSPNRRSQVRRDTDRTVHQTILERIALARRRSPRAGADDAAVGSKHRLHEPRIPIGPSYIRVK